MRKAGKKDMLKMVDIIACTLNRNLGITWMLRKRGNKNKQIKRLAKYAFVKTFIRDGAYISSNEKSVALCYKFNKKAFSLKEILYEIVFVITSVNFCLIPQIVKLEAYKKQIRPKTGEYLYFWIFAALKNNNNAGFELKNEIYKQSVLTNLPVYAETSVERNKYIYERYGFTTYHYFEDMKIGLQYWFLKLEPEDAQKHYVENSLANLNAP